LARTRLEVRTWLDPDRQCFEGRSKSAGCDLDGGGFFTPAWAKPMVNVQSVGRAPRSDSQGQHRQ
jgi:hypothetical protein